MINKSNPCNEKPRKILGKIGDNEKTGYLVSFEEKIKDADKDARNPEPPNSRITHTAKGRAQVFVDRVSGIE